MTVPSKFSAAPKVPIQGVKTRALRVVPDERGWLMEILRADDELFQKFGQVYVSADAGDSWMPIVHDLPAVLSVEVQTLQ